MFHVRSIGFLNFRSTGEGIGLINYSDRHYARNSKVTVFIQGNQGVNLY